MSDMDSGSNTASNFIWAFALIIIVAIIVGGFYYGGFIGGKSQKHEIDVNIQTPSRWPEARSFCVMKKEALH